ncbi:MAG: hypothetical protein ACK48V_00860 [Crocinitomicaceae bacterium]
MKLSGIKQFEVMRSIYFFLVIFVFAIYTEAIQAQTTVTIGTGTSTDYSNPFETYFNYGWSSQLYLKSELGAAGSISAIGYYVTNSGSSYTLDNQKVYIRHSSASSFADKYYPGTTGFTLVYSGSITFGSTGWKTIPLSTPFAYNGTDNLEILIESRDGSSYTSAVQTRYTSQAGGTIYRTKYDYNDYSFPATYQAGGRLQRFSNIQFTINTCANVGGTTSASPSSVCTNGSTTLSLTGNIGSPIQWQSSSDNTTFTDIIGATSSSYSATGLTSSKYYRAKIGSGTCVVNSSSSLVTVNLIPDVPIVGNTGPVCVGSPLSLTSNTIAGATYSWTGPNGFTSTIQNPSVSSKVTSLMAGTYSVTATVNGCTSAPISTIVIINNKPNPPTVGNNGPVCVGNQLSLTSNFIEGATYNWIGPNNFSSSSQNPIVSTVATDLMSGDYTLTINFLNCPSVSTTTSVIVKNRPVAPQTLSTIDVCEGNPLLLTGESNSISTYEWIGPNNFTSNLLNVLVTSDASSIHSGTYTLFSISNDCKSIGQSTIVNVNSKPQVNTGINATIALGASHSLGALSVNGNTYAWSSMPVGFNSTNSNPTVSPTTTTTYNLLVTNTNGCSNSGSVLITVTVPPLDVTFKVFNSSCSVDNSGAIETTITGGVAPYTFNWNTGHETKNISGIGAGNYTLEVTDASNTTQKITKSVAIGISPEWQYLKGLKYTNDGVVLKTAVTGNENSWASSSNSFIGDGWISYRITSKSTKYMIGFSKSRHKEGNHDLGTPIDYGIEQDYSQENLYKSNNAITYTSYKVGDIIKISREGAAIKYYKNGVLLSNFTDAVNPTTILYVELTMSDLNSTIEDLKVNFCNADESDLKKISYAKPLRKLDGGYYETDKGVLRFIFEEEYSVVANTQLNFVIYDMKKNEVMRSLGGGVCSAPKVNVENGINKIELNFSSPTCLNTGEYYIIELKNSKNESVYMRFKYEI